MNYLMVILGGGAGSLLRYLAALMLPRAAEHNFPYATLLVNLVGCFVIGILYHRISGNDVLRLLFITGALGGFTTFSSFGLEGFQLMLHKQWQLFTCYILATNICGMMLVWCGYKLSAIL